MTDIHLTEATPADAPEITRLIGAAYESARARNPDLPDVSGGVLEDIASNDVLIARADGGIVGVVICVGKGSAVQIANVAVLPDRAGQGIGKMLIAAAEKHARSSGAERIDLATHRDMAGNIAMYRHLGWKVTGREGNKVYMSRTLA